MPSLIRCRRASARSPRPDWDKCIPVFEHTGHEPWMKATKGACLLRH